MEEARTTLDPGKLGPTIVDWLVPIVYGERNTRTVHPRSVPHAPTGS